MKQAVIGWISPGVQLVAIRRAPCALLQQWSPGRETRNASTSVKGWSLLNRVRFHLEAFAARVDL